MQIKIRQAVKKDLKKIIDINLDCFPNDNKDKKQAKKWIESTFNAYPRVVYFVAEMEGKVAGYINWTHIGGFRSGVVELDQIGVHSRFQGKKIGQILLKESLEEMKKISKKKFGVKIKIVKVDTATDNKAKEFYKKYLGAKEEAVLKNFFYGKDEAIMLHRFSSK